MTKFSAQKSIFAHLAQNHGSPGSFIVRHEATRSLVNVLSRFEPCPNSRS